MDDTVAEVASSPERSGMLGYAVKPGMGEVGILAREVGDDGGWISRWNGWRGDDGKDRRWVVQESCLGRRVVMVGVDDLWQIACLRTGQLLATQHYLLFPFPICFGGRWRLQHTLSLWRPFFPEEALVPFGNHVPCASCGL